MLFYNDLARFYAHFLHSLKLNVFIFLFQFNDIVSKIVEIKKIIMLNTYK